jgi:hypothetical protein
MLVLELRPDEVQDDLSPPERAGPHVYEHLKYFLSLSPTMPAIRVVIDANGVRILKGHRYLRIARELRRDRILAIVDKSSEASSVDALAKARRNVEPSEWEGDPSKPALEWHVVFFDAPLNDVLAARFRALVDECFAESSSKVIAAAGDASVRSFHVDPDSRRIAFEAQTPWADEPWVHAFSAKLLEFSNESGRILTYRGRLLSSGNG